MSSTLRMIQDPMEISQRLPHLDVVDPRNTVDLEMGRLR